MIGKNKKILLDTQLLIDVHIFFYFLNYKPQYTIIMKITINVLGIYLQLELRLIYRHQRKDKNLSERV